MTWIAMLAVGAGSFLFRVGPLELLQRVRLSDRWDRTIRHAGTAAITALIAGSVRHSAGGHHALPALLAVGVGTLLAARQAPMLRLVGVSGAVYAAAIVLSSAV